MGGDKSRYEVLGIVNEQGHSTLNDGNNNGQSQILRKGTASGPTKEFLSGSEMRRVKAANGLKNMEQTSRDHQQDNQAEHRQPILKRSLAGPKESVPASNRRPNNETTHHSLSHVRAAGTTTNDPIVEMEIATYEETIVEETPMDQGEEPKPPDPSNSLLETEGDEIMTEGNDGGMNWGNRFAPLGENELEA
ncbi:hypothetical protein PIB30_060673 [Stylosanthes scabra]|uniref:Uncharacterized protein n=1 Tax=Stylosanthes scabra TaxID=79078 RepID=A0ABU6ZJ96_9FABA|nr:hypothetical protein [Stylosanthes scabra]